MNLKKVKISLNVHLVFTMLTVKVLAVLNKELRVAEPIASWDKGAVQDPSI